MKICKILLVATFLFQANGPVNAQFLKVVKENFRVNPFEGKFSAFINALTTDPDLLNKQVILKTDTTFFFLKGSYKVFNPFRLNAQRVDMVFAEQETDIVRRSSQSTYTSYTYQILAYFNDTEANRKLLLRDFNRLKRRLTRDGMKTTSLNLKGVKNIEAGELINYYYNDSFIYPATLSWQTMSSSKRIAIALIVRLSVYDGEALPAGTVYSTVRIPGWGPVYFE